MAEQKGRLYLTIRFITRTPGAYPGTGSEERETRRGSRACRTEYRAKRSAAIFLATYVTGVETRRERLQVGRKGRRKAREKKPVANFRPSRTTIVPDGGTLDYSQGIFQLSKSLRRFLFLKRRIRKCDSSRLRDSLRKVADNSIRFFSNRHNFIYRLPVLDKLVSLIFLYKLTHNSHDACGTYAEFFSCLSICNQYVLQSQTLFKVCL